MKKNVTTFWIPVILGLAFFILGLIPAEPIAHLSLGIRLAIVVVGILLIVVAYTLAAKEKHSYGSRGGTAGDAFVDGNDSQSTGGDGGTGSSFGQGGSGGRASVRGHGSTATGGKGGNSI